MVAEEVFEIELLQNSSAVQLRMKSLSGRVPAIWDFKSRNIKGLIELFPNEISEKPQAKLQSYNTPEIRIALRVWCFVMTALSSCLSASLLWWQVMVNNEYYLMSGASLC